MLNKQQLQVVLYIITLKTRIYKLVITKKVLNLPGQHF